MTHFSIFRFIKMCLPSNTFIKSLPLYITHLWLGGESQCTLEVFCGFKTFDIDYLLCLHWRVFMCAVNFKSPRHSPEFPLDFYAAHSPPVSCPLVIQSFTCDTGYLPLLLAVLGPNTRLGLHRQMHLRRRLRWPPARLGQ